MKRIEIDLLADIYQARFKAEKQALALGEDVTFEFNGKDILTPHEGVRERLTEPWPGYMASLQHREAAMVEGLIKLRIEWLEERKYGTAVLGLELPPVEFTPVPNLIYDPLTLPEVQALLTEAQATATADVRVNRIHQRLHAAIPGMTDPYPLAGPVFRVMVELDQLYTDNFRNTDIPWLTQQVFALLKPEADRRPS